MRTEQKNREIAQLLFPDIDTTPESVFKRYPKRKLQNGEYVTRFAPSPTGFLHVGAVYISFLNRKLADQTKGVCILRIEDTDKEREIEGGIELIIKGLKEFGIEFDESVEKGKYGPYIQSGRLEIYKIFAKDMVSRGVAYPCFMTKEQLGEIRDKQNKLGIRTGCYGEWAKWRDASFNDIKEALDDGQEFVIRLYSTGDFNERFEFDDLIKGRVVLSSNDMDAVLLKSDGYPTYHFAHPIDDILMGITLVIRADEWFSSVPLHLELFEKLGFEKIPYAHISPLMKIENGNKRKFSKRKDPEADTRYFLREGYPITAILEYFLNIMNSNFSDWRNQNQTLSYTKFELKLEKFNRAGALFDMVKLADISKNYISKLSADEVYTYLLEWAKEYSKDFAKRLISNRGYCTDILNIERSGEKIRKDIVKWSDIERQFEIFFDDVFKNMQWEFLEIEKGLQKDILNDFVDTYYFNDTKEEWFKKVKNIAVNRGFADDYKEYEENPDKYKGKVGDVAMIIRVAVTGKKQTPDLYEIMQVMGEERIKGRICQYINSL